MKRKILSLIVLSCLITACDQKEQSSQQGQIPPANVSFTTVHSQNVPIVQEYSGRIVALMTADVRPQISGIIKKRLFKEGDTVKEGDVLYEIDSSTYQAAYNQAQASLGQLKSTSSLAALKSKRYGQLIQNSSIAKQDYDDARSAAQQANFNVEAAKAQLETAKINLDRTKIRAPISGQIGLSAVTPGSLVTADQSDALSTIRATDKVYVDFTQTSVELLKLKKYLLENNKDISESPVSLVLEDGSEYPIKGKLMSGEVSVDESTGSITMRAVFENPHQLLLPGAFVRVKLAQYETPAILVPQQALIRSGDGKSQAYIVDSNNKAKLVSVVAKENSGDNWMVTEGLKDNDKVVLEGVSKLKDGQDIAMPDNKGDE